MTEAAAAATDAVPAKHDVRLSMLLPEARQQISGLCGYLTLCSTSSMEAPQASQPVKDCTARCQACGNVGRPDTDSISYTQTPDGNLRTQLVQLLDALLNLAPGTDPGNALLAQSKPPVPIPMPSSGSNTGAIVGGELLSLCAEWGTCRVCGPEAGGSERLSRVLLTAAGRAHMKGAVLMQHRLHLWDVCSAYASAMPGPTAGWAGLMHRA